jgi:hypothetical protein
MIRAVVEAAHPRLGDTKRMGKTSDALIPMRLAGSELAAQSM